jgi:hypothetical protein
MSDQTSRTIIEKVAGAIDIPNSAYDKAEARYKDLGEFFCGPEAQCADFDPHVRPQGSFRLGTVVRAEEYDLDFGVRLCDGVTKGSHTQEQLKAMVGADMEAYRRTRGIQQRLEEKTRCWRLMYKDEMPFHMDGVPSIPEDHGQRQLLQESMVKYGASEFLAQTVAEHAGAITDNRLPNYRVISPQWRISNSEGFALWFESRMKLAAPLMEKRAFEARAGTVDDLPARKWKSPLQRSIQILKVHRDLMFADNPDAKPISVIVTTLAGEAYQGEEDVASALETILTRMGKLVRPGRPRIPNPVNPAEDFADKWYDPAYKNLNLEQNFKDWLRQAGIDFEIIRQSRDSGFITEQAMTKFGAALDADDIRRELRAVAPAIVTRPKTHTIVETPAKPWACN